MEFEKQFNIGEKYQGGIIAFIDNTGMHGLIAAEKDLDQKLQWHDGNNIKVRTYDGINRGLYNTNLIIEKHGIFNYAAYVCSQLIIGGYNDWYLPSKDELNQLYLNHKLIGNFISDCYWSSSEATNFSGLSQDFSNGFQEGTLKDSFLFVRPIRSF